MAVAETVVVGGLMCQLSKTRRETVEDLGVGRRADRVSLGLVPQFCVSAMRHRSFETWRSRGYGVMVNIDTEAQEERWRLLYRGCRYVSRVRVWYKEATRKERMEFKVLHEAA